MPNYGLLWWRIPEKTIYTVNDELLEEFKAAGVAESFIAKFKSLKGSYDNVNIPPEKLTAVFGSNWNEVLELELYTHYPTRAISHMSEAYIGYKAEGWLGQYIVIYPAKKLVACRMIKKENTGPETEMRDFEKYVYQLVK